MTRRRETKRRRTRPDLANPTLPTRPTLFFTSNFTDRVQQPAVAKGQPKSCDCVGCIASRSLLFLSRLRRREQDRCLRVVRPVYAVELIIRHSPTQYLFYTSCPLRNNTTLSLLPISTQLVLGQSIIRLGLCVVHTTYFHGMQYPPSTSVSRNQKGH